MREIEGHIDMSCLIGLTGSDAQCPQRGPLKTHLDYLQNSSQVGHLPDLQDHHLRHLHGGQPSHHRGPCTGHHGHLTSQRKQSQRAVNTHKRREDKQWHEGTSTIIEVYITGVGEQLPDKGLTSHTKGHPGHKDISQYDKTGTGERSEKTQRGRENSRGRMHRDTRHMSS